MDGFDDAFGSGAENNTAEVDPAAEFLAKEQEDLGGLGEDLGFTSPPVQEATPVSSQNGEQSFDLLAEVGAEPPLVSDFEAAPEADPVPIQQDETPAPALESAAGGGSVETLSQGFNGMKVREEPESIKKWKAEQEIRLQEKDKAEEESKEELKKRAEKELEDWYKRYNEQLEKTKESNRSEEETVVAEINDIKPGTEWERVAKQCDFSSKNTRNTKDISRMRSILLQLKQNPPTRD